MGPDREQSLSAELAAMSALLAERAATAREPGIEATLCGWLRECAGAARALETNLKHAEFLAHRALAQANFEGARTANVIADAVADACNVVRLPRPRVPLLDAPGPDTAA